MDRSRLNGVGEISKIHELVASVTVLTTHITLNHHLRHNASFPVFPQFFTYPVSSCLHVACDYKLRSAAYSSKQQQQQPI